MTDAVRWGLLSTARINQALIAGIRVAEGAQLVAVASRSEAVARAYAAENEIPRAHGSYEALLADPEVDVIYNPLPNSLHVPWSIRALEAGKHVLCEKPMSRRTAEVEEAFDVADGAGRVLMEAFMWRYHEQTEVLTRLVRQGAIGPVRHVRAAFSFSMPSDSGNVRWDASLDGGALMDVGCYCVSALRLLLGEPVRVSAEQVVAGPGEGVDARMAGLLRFDGDVLGSFECGIDTVARSALEVYGSDGALLSTDPWHGGSPNLVRVDADGTRTAIPVTAINPYAREVEDLSRAVRDGGGTRLGREDAVAQARTIEALYAAAAEGRAVTVR
jgi:D-xylose 1-dehydrogenase (NADP+, D-xylono-1,5-lactone-forming)